MFLRKHKMLCDGHIEPRVCLSRMRQQVRDSYEVRKVDCGSDNKALCSVSSAAMLSVVEAFRTFWYTVAYKIPCITSLATVFCTVIGHQYYIMCLISS